MQQRGCEARQLYEALHGREAREGHGALVALPPGQEAAQALGQQQQQQQQEPEPCSQSLGDEEQLQETEELQPLHGGSESQQQPQPQQQHVPEEQPQQQQQQQQQQQHGAKEQRRQPQQQRAQEEQQVELSHDRMQAAAAGSSWHCTSSDADDSDITQPSPHAAMRMRAVEARYARRRMGSRGGAVEACRQPGAHEDEAEGGVCSEGEEKEMVEQAVCWEGRGLLKQGIPQGEGEGEGEEVLKHARARRQGGAEGGQGGGEAWRHKGGKREAPRPRQQLVGSEPVHRQQQLQQQQQYCGEQHSTPTQQGMPDVPDSYADPCVSPTDLAAAIFGCSLTDDSPENPSPASPPHTTASPPPCAALPAADPGVSFPGPAAAVAVVSGTPMDAGPGAARASGVGMGGAAHAGSPRTATPRKLPFSIATSPGSGPGNAQLAGGVKVGEAGVEGHACGTLCFGLGLWRATATCAQRGWLRYVCLQEGTPMSEPPISARASR